MRDLLNLIRWMLLGRFRSKSSLEAEILALRHQLNVLRRTSPRRPVFSNFDRMIFVCLYRIAPRILDAITIVELETVIRWHRAGFRSFWRWKSSRRAGRPSVPPEIRRLIREMSLVRDHDRVYGEAFTRRLRAIGIRDRPTAPRSPWQNAYVERLIGSIRRECLDHVIVFGERHLRHVLRSYMSYYNGTRTHLALAKDSPLP